MNYHTQNSDPVATVVTEVGRMSVNEKPPYNGACALQRQHAFPEEEEEAGVYSGHHGGTGAVQKDGYGAQKAYPHGAEVGGYGYLLHAAAMKGRAAQASYLKRYEHQIGGAGGQLGGGGALTQEYESDGSEEYEDESDCSEEELAYGQYGTGGAQQYYEGYKHPHGSNVVGYSYSQPFVIWDSWGETRWWHWWTGGPRRKN